LGGFDDFERRGRSASALPITFLQVGDTITLVTPKGATTPFGTAPRTKGGGLPGHRHLELGMSEFDATFVYIPLADAQAFFNRGGRHQRHRGVPRRCRQGRRRSAGRSRWRRSGPVPSRLAPAQPTFFAALEVERNVMFIILTLIVLVAALNIVSGLIMLVKDKSSDIAILRTMGATSGAVMRVFLITGASIGVFGTLAGFCLGLGLRGQHPVDPGVRVLDAEQTALGPDASLSFADSRGDQRVRSGGRGRDGDRPVAPCDALSRRGARRGSIRSKRSATADG
jgi:hypothetical protein